MLMRRIKPRKFNYTPRYLSTDEEETEGKKRIKFKRFVTVKRGSTSLYKLLIITVLLLLFLYSLPRISEFFSNLFS